MGGIAGVLDKREADSSDLTWILTCMLDLMAHRGPDHRDQAALNGLWLGRQSLSCKDEPSPDLQPGGGRWSVAYDGRLYNSDQVRRELEAGGAVFRSRADEEIILHAYRQWGLDGFCRLNGMWATAIWDREERRLVLSRDRVGVKPLYWSTGGDRLAFASEIKAVAAFRRLTGQTVEINPEAIRHYLNEALTDGLEETFFHGILHFQPGHCMVVEGGRIRTYQPYWNLPRQALDLRERTRGRTESDHAGRLFRLLEDAVKIHAPAREPVGVHLSGDLDSSIVAGLGSRVGPKVKAFTPRFEDGLSGHEWENAGQMRIAFGLEGHSVDIKGRALPDRLPEILWRMEAPFMDMSVYPQWEIMEAAAKEVTVIQDGLGGDELFGGLASHPPWRLSTLLASGRTGEYQGLLKGYGRNEGAARAEALDREARELTGGGSRDDMPDLFPGRLDNLLYHELTRTRLPALLRCRDRLASAFSMEYRAPLLDYRLIETAFALDEEWKIGPGWSKYVLRRSMEDFLPYDITWDLENKGLLAPFQFWAGEFHNPGMRELLLGGQSHLKSTIGEDLLKGFFQAWDQGHKNHWQLWHLVCLEMWLKTWTIRLTREINASIGTQQRRIDPILSEYPSVQPLEVVIAIEYGGAVSPESGPDSPNDIKTLLIQPTDDLVRLLERQGARLTVLWNTAGYFQLVDNGLTEDAGAIEEQLQSLAARGHDVQLFLDSEWLAERSDGLEALVQRSIDTMTRLFRPLRFDYEVRGFRAGSLQVETVGRTAQTLMKYGLKADSSLRGLGPLGVKAPGVIEQVPLKEADFLTFPVFFRENEHWDLNDSPMMPVSKLKGDPPANPPFGATLVMAGRIMGPGNLFELDLCLNHLKKEYGRRLRFCRWQESIDRRLSVMQGEWYHRMDSESTGAGSGPSEDQVIDLVQALISTGEGRGHDHGEA